GRRKLAHVVDIEAVQRAPDARVEPALLQELPVGIGGGRETARHLHAEARERADHLADRGILATDCFDVILLELLERQYVRSQMWGSGNPLQRTCRVGRAMKHSTV